MTLQSNLHAESHGVVPDQEGTTEESRLKVPVGLTHHDPAGHVPAHLLGKEVDPVLALVTQRSVGILGAGQRTVLGLL